MPDTKAGDQKTILGQSLMLVSSAIFSASSIPLFPVKWQSIRDKLGHLHSSLGCASRSDDSKENSVLNKLLQDISDTARNTVLLAHRCCDDYYKGGKLFLKSDLDVIAVKLELHINHLNEIYASGILKNFRAIILCKPGIGASREDMRLFVKDIFSRLKIGDMEMRARALAALSEVLKEDEKYAGILAVETIDGVTILVNLLESKVMNIQEEGLEAISVIAGFESYRGILVMAGVIPPLIRVLEWGSELAKERATRALKHMTDKCNNAWLVSSQGGVTALLKICSDNSSTCRLINLACGVLRNLIGVGEIKRFMVEQGAISILLKLLRSNDEMSKIQAMEFLYKLGLEDEAIKQNVVRDEVIESLLTVMNPDTLYSSKVREVSLRAIVGLCFTSTTNVNYLLGAGFLDRLLYFLKNGERSDQESALKAVSSFCRVSEEVKKAMGEVGFLTELVRLLETRSFKMRETAAETLCSLILVHKNKRRFIKEENNVDRVLQMLNPEEGKFVTIKLLLSAIVTLTDSSTGRRKVATSVYMKNLEKFAETNVLEAKKILKRLSSNKFLSILNGIWNS